MKNSKYTLNAGEWNNVFAVPSSVVDKYIKLASGNSLKLLMFLLRHGGESFSEDELKSKLGFRETGELADAALFWVQRGIIRYENDSEESREFLAAAERSDSSGQRGSGEQTEAMTEARVEVNSAALPKPVSVSSGEIAGRMNSDKQIKMLFEEAERIKGGRLNQRDNQTVISLVDHYGLPAEVALMLLQYCKSADKLKPAYILSVAADWAGKEVNTIELADARIRELERQNAMETRLRKSLEMNTKFAPKQKEFIRVWSAEWGFGEEMILLACDKEIAKNGSWSGSYTNKILENWEKQGIRTKEAAERAEEEFRKTNENVKKTPVKTAANQGSSFNMDDVMSRIKNSYK